MNDHHDEERRPTEFFLLFNFRIVYTENVGEEKDQSEFIDGSLFSGDSSEVTKLQTLIEVLSKLNKLSCEFVNARNESESRSLLEKSFESKKLNEKMMKEIEDSMVAASSSFPRWASLIKKDLKFFFPLETRQTFFRTISFGTSRSIVFLQERRDEFVRAARQGRNRNSTENSSGSVQELRFGRLKIDRATSINREEILRDATNLFHSHAAQKSKLEIQFLNEEGTGDGPTLEFYGLVAHEFQRSALKLWWNNRSAVAEFVMNSQGLFPIPLPENCENLQEILFRFETIGIFFGKSLMDRYLIDMPLSNVFIRKVFFDETTDLRTDIEHLSLIEPTRGNFFKKLFQLVEQRKLIFNDSKLSEQEKIEAGRNIRIQYDDQEPIELEHLWSLSIFVDPTKPKQVFLSNFSLNFTFSPPSNDSPYRFHELLPNGVNLVSFFSNE